jgi:hypothetical protein
MPDAVDYPQHERLATIKDKSQAIGEFLDWMSNEGLVLCQQFTISEEWPDEKQWLPVFPNKALLLAKFFQIDYDELMAEKDRMLADFRRRTGVEE